MKAPRCPIAFAASTLTVLIATVLLTQCAMPPQQAWRYIQTNGLLPYLSSSGQHGSPPFRSGSTYSQRYAAGQANQSRSSFLHWSSSMPNRSYYGAASPSGYAPNTYFSAPSSGAVSSRPVPRSRPRAALDDHSPNVKIPVEEPSAAPQITHHQPSSSPAPTTNGSASSHAAATESLPYGTAVPGRLNMVNSPFAGKTQLVDVSGMSTGQTVKCPYTGKLFKVPPTQQAANHSESNLESKVEASKGSEESKAGDKKP